MGIPAYFSFIVKNHPSIIKKIIKNDPVINNLYMDCNSIVYDIAHALNLNDHSDIEATIIHQVISKIEYYIFLIQPKTNIMIAFDGVAPFAKLDQQRTRRFKSNYIKQISNTINPTNKKTWNTTSITPGTSFMDKLNKSLNSHFTKNKFPRNNVIVSTSSEPGEGEHKIFEYIRVNSEEHKSQNTLVYGLDADLIMLSINHLPIAKNIYLFRETPEFIKSIDSSLEPNQHYLLDIPYLAEIITLDMNNGKPLVNDQQKNRIYDYIFLCFFLGNDFLPHFPSLNIRTGGIDKLINAYKYTLGNTNNNLTDGKSIHWKHLRTFISFLAQQEHKYLLDEMKLRNKRENKNLPEDTPELKYKKFDSIPTFERSLEKYIDPFNDYWEKRYYKTLFDIDANEERLKQISINYLQGLEWTMRYYTEGCVDWKWSYNYNYPPLLSDLIKFTPYFDTQFIKPNENQPVSPLTQLSYVLPRSSLNLLPHKIYQKLLQNYGHYYPEECDFVWAFSRYFWESHVLLPHIDINRLENIIQH
jgi:5'-3' exonuclease